MASDIYIRIGATLEGLNKKLKEAESQLKRFSFKAERVGRDLTTRVSLPIIGIGTAAVATFAKFDKLEKGLAAISGSSAEAERQMGSLLDVVKDTRTTLDLKTAATASLQLQAVGRSAKDTENTLKQLAIAATVSGSSADDVGEVARQLSQASAKGQILQQELRIILERIPGLASVIAKEFGTVTAEGLRNAGVGADEFIDRLTAAVEVNERFQNVQGGISKALETFGINLQIAGAELGKTISESLNLEAVLTSLSDLIFKAVEGFKQLSPATQKIIVFTAAAAAAIGPLTFALGAAAKSVVFLRSGIGVLTGTVSTLLTPLKAIGGFLLKVASNTRILTNGFALLANPITRVVGFTQVIYGLRAAMAALLGPVNIIIAVISGLVVGFKAAQKNSVFFNTQLAKLKETFGRVFSAIGNVASQVGGVFSKLFSSIGIGFNKIGISAKSFQSVLGGVVSVILEAFSILAEGIAEFVEGFSLLLDGEFKKSFSKFGSSFQKLTPVGLFGQEGQRLANAFATTYTETLDGLNSEAVVPIVSPLGNGIGSTSDNDPLSAGGSGEGSRAAVEPLSKLAGGLSLFEQEANKAAIASRALQLANEDMAIGFAEATNPIIPAQNALNRLGEGFDLIEAKAEVFGASYDVLKEKISLVTAELNRALEEGYSPTSTVVEGLREQLEGLNTQLDETANGPLALLGDVLTSAFSAFEQQAASGAASLKQFAGAALQASRKVISAYIKEGVAGAVKNTLATVPFPLNIALAGAAGSAASGLFNTLLNTIKIPGLAQGGLVNSPTLAMIGEAGPEVAIPLARLEQIISGGAGGAGGEFILRGSDLVLANERASRSRARIIG